MRAIDSSLCQCQVCGKLCRLPDEGDYHCRRCHSSLHRRRPHAIATTWALSLTALVLFVPANLYPIMTISELDDSFERTIMAGVIDLARHDMLPIAIVVFVASIAVPLFKLIGIMGLLVALQRGHPISRRQATRMYRFIDLIGRWSMLDLFVISILVTLVNFGRIASVEANIGASAFAGVVVLTLLAAQSFDPRLIWDLQDKDHDG